MSPQKMILAGKKTFLAWWRPTRPARRSTPLRGELLEGRDVPTVFIWDPFANYNWSQPGNWVKLDAAGDWESTLDVPGGADTAEFLGDANFGCFVDVGVTVAQVFVKNDYTSIIQLNAPLTVSGTSGSGSGLFIDSPATILGNGGSLTIDGSATFVWRAGTLQALTVAVNPTATMNVPVPLPGASALTMTTAGLDIKGTLSWGGGSVTVTNPAPSSIHVFSGGAFNITAAGGTWGGTDRSQFSVVNYGAVTLNAAGIATLKGDYVSYGATTLTSGTLALGGLAEQGAGGTFRLSPGTIAYLTPPADGGVGVLGIRDGLLTGTGSIQGTLVLGNDPPNQLTTTPILQPDGGGGSGVILVTGDFTIFNGQVQIGISGPTVYDRVNVGGTAALAGRVVGILQQGFQPIPAGNKIVFLTYGSRVGDFATIGYPGPNPPWFAGKDDNGTHRYWFDQLPGIIRGRVWNDGWHYTNGTGHWDEDGIQGSPDQDYGWSGILVHLLNADGVEIASTTTDSSGYYTFTVVAASQYQVKVDLPPPNGGGYITNTYEFTAEHQGGDSNLDSDVDAAGYTDLFVLDLGDTVERDAGIIDAINYSI